MSNSKEIAYVTVRVPKDLHLDCKVKLAKEGKSFVGLVIEALERYRDGGEEVE